jgi:DNA polymerase III subunit epsilon
MRAGEEGGGCFPTGRHYPGIAHLLRIVAQGLVDEFDGGSAIADVTLVSIDTETTGRDPAVDRIVEFAAVVWKNGEAVARHRWLVNPGRPIPQEAFDVHGINDEAVANQPPFSAVASEILAILEGKVPLAYNADFDRAFLVEELGRAGMVGRAMPPAARRGIEWVDPLVWARELQKEEKSKALGEVAERLGIALEKAHSAVHDAEAAVRVLAAFFADDRVPKAYGAFIQEQRRIARLHEEDRQYWRK